jgi:histidyl-tRNA synthetase
VCRVDYKEKLKNYLIDKSESLCGECRKRSKVNPLRVFDCKIESCKSVVSSAPVILDFICDDCKEHFELLKEYLGDIDIGYIINKNLVRGLDYYSRTTFEIQTDKLGTQNAVAGGGRYDTLIKQLDGPDHSGIGFAIGFERLVALLETGENQISKTPDIFLIALGNEAARKAFKWTNELRKAGKTIEMEYGEKSLKAQMKRADRLSFRRVLIVGDNELKNKKAIIRDMATKEQEEIPFEGLIENILSRI